LLFHSVSTIKSINSSSDETTKELEVSLAYLQLSDRDDNQNNNNNNKSNPTSFVSTSGKRPSSLEQASVNRGSDAKDATVLAFSDSRGGVTSDKGTSTEEQHQSDRVLQSNDKATGIDELSRDTLEQGQQQGQQQHQRNPAHDEVRRYSTRRKSSSIIRRADTN
jgi:hypothetical protein